MLNTVSWKEFKLSDLFPKIERGTRLTEYNREPGSVPLATAGYQNEGIADFISNVEQKRYINKITIDMFCNVFYRDYEFCCDDNILVLINDEYNQNICLFLSTIIQKDKFRFAYGRQYRKKDFFKHTIKLPIDADGNPNWKYMNDYIEELQMRERESEGAFKNLLKTDNTDINVINSSSWKLFKIGDYFNVYLSKGDLKEDECDAGTVKLISSGSNNNGLVKYINSFGDGKAEIFKGNCLTIDMFCNCFYQDSDFYSVSHGRVNILYPKFSQFCKEIGLFIASVIKHEQYRFSYGRAVYSSVAENITIKLPCDKDDNPDWNYMINYINKLPYADRI